MSPEEQEAAMAALEHIQDTLASVKGLKMPGEESAEQPVDGPPNAGEAEPLEADEANPVEAELAVEEVSEPEPERFVEAMGSVPPADAPMPEELPPKRGPGRPKKVR